MTRERPIVTTSGGDVRGVWREEYSAAFLGIPYAEPPINELRFEAPVARKPWEGVREANSYGPTPQRRQLAEVTAIPEPSIPGEDTLSVNVFTPKPGDLAAQLPVYVWIHGGGYMAGSAASPWYDGRNFNRDGIVTVSLSYRLGFDGFGWLPDAPHNRGVLDWILALEWVRDNIARFGGDPGRVTIAGQSAGGGAVLNLLSIPTIQGLFHQVISHSGAAMTLPEAKAAEVTKKFAELCGVEATKAGFATLSETLVLDKQDEIGGALGGDPLDMMRGIVTGESSMVSFSPYLDGELIVADPMEAFADGVGATKPLLLGATANEFNMITEQAPKAMRLLPPKPLLKKAGLSADKAKAYVKARKGLNTLEIIGQLLTDYMFRVPAVRYVQTREVTKSKTWLYDFSWVSPANGSSPHCLDLPFAWDCLDSEHVEANTGPNPPQALADQMHSGWVKFITNGDPGWEECQGPRYPAQVFTMPTTGTADAYTVERMLAAPEQD